MIRIVGIQRHDQAEGEFVLLQNQGGVRLGLRGHMVLADDALGGGPCGDASHVFSDDEMIPPGCYVMLRTSDAPSRWSRTKDGATIYHTSMRRDRAVWSRASRTLHVLNTQHTFRERAAAPALVAA